jgi:hypothetical protein
MKHKHHIVPKHMGGSADKENIVELTIEEHAEAHRVLWETYGKWQDYLAWNGLLKRIKCEEVAREASRLANTGKLMSEETRKKISISKKGVKHSKEHIENNRKAQTGKILSQEHREKIKKALSGKRKNESHIASVAESNRGKKRSIESRKRMSEAAKIRHARNRNSKYEHTRIIEIAGS